MQRLILTSIAALAASAVPAFAQDASNFSGAYAGLLAGYDHVTLDDGTDKGSKDGVVYGVVLGYDADLGSTVAGIEAEANDSSVSQTVTDILTAGDSATLSANRDLYIGVRGGFKVAPNVLLYAKGGYTNTRVSAKYNDGNGTVLKDHLDLDGYRIGGGVEYKMGRIALRGEYRFSDYGNTTYQGFNTGVSARRHQVVATVIGKF